MLEAYTAFMFKISWAALTTFIPVAIIAVVLCVAYMLVIAMLDMFRMMREK